MYKIIQESIGYKIEDRLSVIMNKSSTVPESLIKNIVYIHRGNGFRELKIMHRHVGYKFGEFILTRKLHVFRKKIKTKRR